MNLDFKVLIIDDQESSAQSSISSLRDYLQSMGFSLKIDVAQDLSAAGIRHMSRHSGRNLDLVIIDYQLGSDIDGAEAAVAMRRGMKYTDIVYFSSHIDEARARLVAKGVDGVFTAHRKDLSETLIGVAETIIGKAVDVNHMRGIVMAEVAEMDVVLEATLLEVYAMSPELIVGATDALLKDIGTSNESFARKLRPLVEERRITDIVGNGLLFSSAQKYNAVRALAKKLPAPPHDDLRFLAPYVQEVLEKRNVLAHAKEQVDDVTGAVSLSSARHNQAGVSIDETWLTDYRNSLRENRKALERMCAAVTAHAQQTTALRKFDPTSDRAAEPA